MIQGQIGARAANGAEASRRLDKFFTKPEVAAACVAMARTAIGAEPALWIEPSAGAGAFLAALPCPKIGVDIDPAAGGMIKADFLEWEPPNVRGTIAAIGNPPFGKNASLAVKFFNRAASYCDFVAFIVPRTFEKASIRKRLDRRFSLVFETALDPGSFLFMGEPYAVPAVFQVWAKGPERVDIPAPATHPDFDFVGRGEADFAFQRVGAQAGLSPGWHGMKSPSSHYFLKSKRRDIDVRSVLAAADWSLAKARSAGNPSISKTELVAGYAAALARISPN